MSLTMSFSIMPEMVFVDSSSTLKFVAQNTSKTESVKFTVGRGASYINVLFPDGNEDCDLVSNLSFEGTCNLSNFSCNEADGEFKITSDEEVEIAPGDSLQVTFEKMPINTKTGSAKVTVSYKIDNNSGSKEIYITKKAKELGVIAWLDPLVVGKGQSSLLQFKSASSTKVKISGYPPTDGSKDKEKTFTTPPPSNSDNVTVGPGENGQRNYVVTAYAGSNQSPSVTLTLSEAPPYIFNYSPTEQQTIAPNKEVTIVWGSHFGSGNSMQWLQTQRTDAASPMTLTPGTELVNVYNVRNANASAMPDTVTFDLTVDGYYAPATQDFTFKIEPAQLEYFKYVDKEMTQVAYKVSPDNWKKATQAQLASDPATLTIYQPGYQRDSYYLSATGTEHPMIQYFEASKGELTWITANLVSLTLQVTVPEQDPIEIDADKIKTDTRPIPAGAGTVVLTGVDKDGKSVRSQLELN